MTYPHVKLKKVTIDIFGLVMFFFQITTLHLVGPICLAGDMFGLLHRRGHFPLTLPLHVCGYRQNEKKLFPQIILFKSHA